MHEGHRETGSKDDDHTGHHARMAADFRERFWISLVITLPILVLSPLLQKLVGLGEAIRFSGDHCRQKFLSTPAGAKPKDKSGGCCG